jgi:hypothetical protein
MSKTLNNPLCAQAAVSRTRLMLAYHNSYVVLAALFNAAFGSISRHRNFVFSHFAVPRLASWPARNGSSVVL